MTEDELRAVVHAELAPLRELLKRLHEILDDISVTIAELEEVWDEKALDRLEATAKAWQARSKGDP